MKIIIIGGVAGGATAAARLRRLDENSEIIIIEKGSYVSFANCGLPYYVGGEIPSIDNLLLHTPKSLTERFNLDIRINSEVTQIDSDHKKILVKNNDQVYELNYDYLIISTGAKPIKPNIPGVDLPGIFSVKDIPDVIKIKQYIELKQAKSATIIGGGFIGLEMLEQLKQLGLKVDLVQAGKQVLAQLDPEMAEVVHEELKKQKINLHLSETVTNFSNLNESISIQLASAKSISSDLVILAIGVRPENNLIQDSNIKLGKTGGIIVDEYLETNIKNIFAIGDCIEVKDYINQNSALIALAGPANRQGRIVADNIYGAQKKYPGTLGTAIIRVFDKTIASTGVSEKSLKQLGIPFEKIHLHPLHHVGYFPGAEQINLKVLFNRAGKILGAQAIGKAGVDKRIDIIATAIKADLKITELIDLELSYAPPYGSAKDPINIIGMMAENILDGLVEQSFAEELKPDNYLLDVRSLSEYRMGAIPNAIHIPLTELRSKLDLLPKNKEIIVYCQSGQRSYIASRILKLNGFKVKNLSGAYKTWLNYKNI